MEKQRKIKAKKSLGQNFLKSELALKKIIEAGEIGKEEVVLEIGPGKGALTSKLLEKTNKVVAIEKDNQLVKYLQDKFIKEIEEGKLLLVEGDVLEFDLTQTFASFSQVLGGSQPDHSKKTQKFLKTSSYKIIANIPYNITGTILKKFLSEKNQPERMVLMVQHEVAKRILAKDGKESLLSISVKAYGEPSMVIKVPARYFSPAPKVDSAVISIKNISKNLFLKAKIDENTFWSVVKAGFSHKRKVLTGNLKNLNKKVNWTLELEKIKKDKNTRAEDLSAHEWIELVKNFSGDLDLSE